MHDAKLKSSRSNTSVCKQREQIRIYAERMKIPFGVDFPGDFLGEIVTMYYVF